MSITAGTVQTGVLNPAMDAIAVSLTMTDLLHRPQTPEADSITELIELQMAGLLRMAGIVGAIASHNGIVLDLDRKVAGWADQVTTALRHGERNGADGKVATGRQLAEILKPIIDAHLQGDTSAADQIARTVRHIPRSVLLRPAVTHHLAQRRTRTLVSILDRLPERP